MNAVQKQILETLRYQSLRPYNKLWNKQGDSSHFAYHLRALEKKGFVEKREGGYKLSLAGIKYADYLSLPSAQPIQVVVLVVRKGNHVLVSERNKYPYKGYQEFCASKLKQHETVFEAAQERLSSKLGLLGKPTYKGIEFLQTKEDGELLMHHHLHIFSVEQFEGTPMKGEWVTISPFHPKRPLPHIEQTLRIALSSGFSIAISDLIKQGEEYTGYTTHQFLKHSQ